MVTEDPLLLNLPILLERNLKPGYYVKCILFFFFNVKKKIKLNTQSNNFLCWAIQHSGSKINEVGSRLRRWGGGSFG